MRWRLNKESVILCLSCVLFFGLKVAAFSEEPGPREAGKKETVVRRTIVDKEIVGEITWMNARYISVLYQRDPQTGDEYEMLLPWDKKSVGLQYLKSVKDVQQGDTIRVKYAEDSILYDTRRQDVRRKAKTIGLIKKGTPKPKPQPIIGPDSGILKSEIEE